MNNKLSILTGNKDIQLVIAGNPAEMKQVDKYPHDSENVFISENIQSAYKEKELQGYDIFSVLGTSLAIEEIHHGDLVFGKRLNPEEKTQIKSEDIVIFQINHESKRYKDLPNIPDFKLRKFRTFLSLENDNEVIIAQVVPIMSELQQPHVKDTFIKKLNEAKETLRNESLLLLSVNYLNEDIDFSFHCLSELYAKIEYVAKIEEDNKGFIIQNITSVDENKEENLKRALQYLANRRINQYFCSTKESFRKEALLNIFTHAQTKIRGAFNQLSDITKDDELIHQLSIFLKKGGEVNFIVYYNNHEWTLDKFIKTYKLTDESARINIKQTPPGAQFVKNENGTRNGITFCIGDEDMYVLRPNINASFVECNFNNREFYNMIGPIFDQQIRILPTIGL